MTLSVLSFVFFGWLFHQIGAFPDYLYHSQDEPFRSYPCLPQHIHIAQATNVDRDNSKVNMTISFTLDYQNCRHAQPSVLYGRGHQPTHQTATAQRPPLQFNYTSSKSRGNFRSNWIYHIELQDLEAGLQEYWYRIVVVQPPTMPDRRWLLRGSSTSYDSYLGETKSYTFRTPPLPGAPTSLALVGDIGQTDHSLKTLIDIYEQANRPVQSGKPLPISQLLIAGDLSYADSDPYRWMSWLQLVEPLLRMLPMHAAAGNHEIECDTEGRVFQFYEHLFCNPNRLHPARRRVVTEAYRKSLWQESCSAPSVFQGTYDWGNSFYSYQHGLAQIIVLNSYTDSRRRSVQYQWLQEELNRYNRAAAPWLIVSFHAPIYTTFLGHNNETEAMRLKEAMEPLFIAYGVNLVISGHDHAYMRTKPMAYGEVDESGRAPVYLTLGAGGNREGHPGSFLNKNPEPWVAKRTMQDFGYGHLFLPNATNARFQWVRDGTTDNDFEDIVWFSNPHL